jgi:hypothetical protein
MKPREWIAPWLFEGLVPALLTVMAGSLGWALGELALAWGLRWSLLALAGLAAFGALAASASVNVFRRSPRFMTDRWRWWLVQAAAIVLAAKAISLLQQPWATVVADVAAWPRDPLLILDAQTLAGAALGLAVLLSVHATLSDLYDLAESDDVRLTESPRDHIQARFLSGGLLIMVVAGLARVSPSALLDLGRASSGEVVFPVLTYFSAGLALLALTQYIGRAAMWRREGAEVQADLGRRWAWHTLALVGLAAGLALLIPAGQGEGLLGIGRWLAIGLIYVMYAAVLLVVFLITALVSLLSLLFPGVILPTRPAPATPQFPPPPIADPVATWEQLWPFVFWLIVAAMVAVVIWAYLRDQTELWPRVRGSRLLRGLRRLWAQLRGRGARWAADVRRGLAQLRQLGRAPAAPPAWPFWSLRRASAREQVLYFYLSTLKRAGQLGFGRRPAQTPDEYEPDLEARLPDVAADADSLTRAFDAIRYGDRPVDADQARRLRMAWERVRAALRQRAPH